LPERDFFFGVLCTLKRDYMEEIIAAANEKRFKVDQEETKKEAILISDKWMKELTKHPYHSSKVLLVIYVEKSGTGVFLMKESAKLYKSNKDRIQHVLAKRLAPDGKPGDLDMMEANVGEKRKKTAAGQFQMTQSLQGPPPSNSNQ